MKITQEVIDKVKHYLEKYPDMSKADLATMCGCSGTTIRNIANGRYDTGVYVEFSPWHEGSHKKKPEQPEPQEVGNDEIVELLKRIDDALFMSNVFLASIALCTIDEKYGDVDANALSCACMMAKGLVMVEVSDD